MYLCIYLSIFIHIHIYICVCVDVLYIHVCVLRSILYVCWIIDICLAPMSSDFANIMTLENTLYHTGWKKQIWLPTGLPPYLCLSLDDRVLQDDGILGVPSKIKMLLHKWTQQAIYPSRYHIEQHVSFWTSRSMSLSPNHTGARRVYFPYCSKDMFLKSKHEKCS